MRVLHRYLIQDFLIIFSITLMVFTFVMSLSALIKAIDLLAKGIPASTILGIFFYNFPYVMTFSIPMSTLCAVLLLFGRLSMDGELNAMKASGLSMWQIIAPVVLLSVFLSTLCLWINYEASPRSHYARVSAISNLSRIDPLDLLEEGQFNNDIPGLKIFIGSRKGKEIFDVEIHELTPDLHLDRAIRAQRGIVIKNEEKQLLEVTLYDAVVDQRDPDNPIKDTHFPVGEFNEPIDLSSFFKTKKRVKNRKDMTWSELFSAISDVRSLHPDFDVDRLQRQRIKYLIEANKRVTLAMACFSFVLIGIPLGVKSKRKESSSGIGISLLLVFVFYFFVILAESLTKYPQYHPQLIIWIPVFGAQLLGFLLLRRVR